MLSNVWSGLCLSSVLAVSSILAGCVHSGGIVPQAKRLENPELVTDEAIHEAAHEAAWPSDQWWKAYGDPQLDAWVERAVKGSPSLAMAASRVRKALAMAGIDEAALKPQADYSLSIQRKRWPNDHFYGPGVLSQTNTWNNLTTLNISYDLDLWGGLRSKKDRSLSEARVAATEERAAALELQSAIVRTYVQLARHFADRDIAEAELEQRKELLKLANKRFNMGLGNQFEISQAEAPIPEAHRQLDIVEEEIALARNQLAALAGEGPGAGQEIQRPRLSLHVAAPKLPSALPLELLGRRPDLVARRWQVAAMARGIEVSKVEFYPNLNLLANLGRWSTQGDILTFIRQDKLTYSLGPALTLPVYDGGYRRGQLSVATADYDLAVEQYNKTLVDALKSVSDHLIQLHSLHEQEGFVKHGLETAERRYKLAQEAYLRGLTDFRSVLEAETDLFIQRRLEQQVRAGQLSTQAGLWVALGGGVLNADSGPADEKLEAHKIKLRALYKY